MRTQCDWRCGQWEMGQSLSGELAAHDPHMSSSWLICIDLSCDFPILLQGSQSLFQWKHCFLFSPNTYSVPFLYFQIYCSNSHVHHCYPRSPQLECMSASHCSSVSLAAFFSLRGFSCWRRASGLGSEPSFLLSFPCLFKPMAFNSGCAFKSFCKL